MRMAIDERVVDDNRIVDTREQFTSHEFEKY